MMSARKPVVGLFAGLLGLSALAISGAQAASIDAKFNSAVNRMMMGMKDGPVAQMGEAEKKEMVACVQKVFASLPDEKKQYIAEASGEAELRARFDEVGLENRAALKQQVRDECA